MLWKKFLGNTCNIKPGMVLSRGWALCANYRVVDLLEVLRIQAGNKKWVEIMEESLKTVSSREIIARVKDHRQQIEDRDLHRTLPGYLTESQLQDLKKLLFMYAIHRPDTAYVFCASYLVLSSVLIALPVDPRNELLCREPVAFYGSERCLCLFLQLDVPRAHRMAVSYRYGIRTTLL